MRYFCSVIPFKVKVKGKDQIEITGWAKIFTFIVEMEWAKIFVDIGPSNVGKSRCI